MVVAAALREALGHIALLSLAAGGTSAQAWTGAQGLGLGVLGVAAAAGPRWLPVATAGLEGAGACHLALPAAGPQVLHIASCTEVRRAGGQEVGV